MSYVPAHRDLAGTAVSDPLGPYADGESQPRRFSWSVIARSRWLIGACTATVLAITTALTQFAVPIYESSATLRIEEKEPNLDEMFRSISGDRRLVTEIEVLRSRTLAAEPARILGLRLALQEPQVQRRSALLRQVEVADSAPSGTYLLIQRADRRLALVEQRSGRELGTYAAGERVKFGGFGFSLGAAALEHATIRFSIIDANAATGLISGELSVFQPGRDVDIVKVAYRSADRELAWRVPQLLVDSYMRQRLELQALERQSTIGFLRQQIDTISTQLAESERKLEVYRERHEVINPVAEASGQVGRLVAMQTQRGMLEIERNALASLMADVDAKAANSASGNASPYRRLLAFPTLLQGQAATGLLQSLTTAEDARKALLTRRTKQDPDVVALDERINELERELRSIAATYLQGLTSQVQSLTAGMETFRQQLRSIPEKELQYARLERQPKVLEQVVAMLQTRLKESEISAAAGDPSVRVVDQAMPPTGPVWPRPTMNLLAGLVCGLLLGVGASFAREYMDSAIRSRMDVRGATGLPVIGVIPRIALKSSPIALIAEPRKRLVSPAMPPAPRASAEPESKPQAARKYTYTFLQSDEGATAETAETSVPVPKPAIERLSLSIPLTAGVIAEAYGVLQTNIAFSQVDSPVKTLVFTSPLPGDGKTTTVVNLALSLAHRGLRTLLIDGDVRRGVVHSVFGASREPGLSEVLRGILPFERARRGASVGERGTMDYLTSGKLYPHDYGLVASTAMRDLLGRVRDEYDVVIVDTPPVNIMTDAAVLAAGADGVVLVARAGVTEAAALAYAVEQLGRVRARVLGVVLNDIDIRRDSAYDGTYKYFQAYEYSTADR
jgi:capsular exopolysaccharide synthesis family protein